MKRKPCQSGKLNNYLMEAIMDKREMIKEILRNQNRTNDHIFTEKKLEGMNSQMLVIICEASKHMITK